MVDVRSPPPPRAVLTVYANVCSTKGVWQEPLCMTSSVVLCRFSIIGLEA